jgi:alkyl sulfatase BDS1-like metallo-beta-lactamase superfamily hydrolase
MDWLDDLNDLILRPLDILDHKVQEMGEQLLGSLEDETAETFLEMLLRYMQIKFIFDPDYHKNIENFKGSYKFRTRDPKGVKVFVEFYNGHMKMSEDIAAEATVTVTFENGRALRNFLLAKEHDILNCILNNEVVTSGNLNYLNKFAFMANHLMLEVTGDLPQD